MRTDLDHLPPERRQEIGDVLGTILAMFEDAHTRSATGWKKKGRIYKILLYGSFARGGWVYEPHTSKAYSSDYDLLVIVNRQQVVDNTQFWSALDDHFIAARQSGQLKSMPSLIVHTRQEVNNALVQGRYFFTDIVKDAVLLYDGDDTPFPKPRPKSAEGRLAMAKEYFDEWFPMAGEFFDDFVGNLEKDRLNKAAFELHQAVEHLYHTALLVLTAYTPHNHNIKALRSIVGKIDTRFARVWPEDLHWQSAAFNVLRDAYVKARYAKRGYKISRAQLEWLGEMTQELARVVHAVCLERFAELQALIDQAATTSNGEGGPAQASARSAPREPL